MGDSGSGTCFGTERGEEKRKGSRKHHWEDKEESEGGILPRHRREMEGKSAGN